jgi:hypothetical protein
MSTIILARGHVTKADELRIELVEPSGNPPVIMLRWPHAPSITDPNRLPTTANAVMQVLAAAIGRLAAIQREGL